MAGLKKLLEKKGGYVWTVQPAATVEKTIRLMMEQEIGAIIIVENDNIEGIFSERDFTRAVARNRDLSLETPVSELMTRNVLYISSDVSIDDCMGLMIQKRIRHLPVMEEGKLVGIVSMRDIVKDIISEKEITIRGLENYILNQESFG